MKGIGRKGLKLIIAVILCVLCFWALKWERPKELEKKPEESMVQEQEAQSEILTQEEKEEGVRPLYEAYQENFASIATQGDISRHGFAIIREHIFPLEMAAWGEVTVIPAFHREYNRLALFFADGEGKIVCRLEDLETNYRNQGELRQFTDGIAAISFRELNGDGAMDIVIVTAFANETGEYAGSSLKVGDVLFQDEEGKGFYRDYRITDKLNRFGMNKSADLIAAFVGEGYSTEFMYTAATLDDLLENGLEIITEQSYPRNFEKLGRLQVIPGKYYMADYEFLMIYLVNEEGYIVSSLQPMENYDNLYALRGISCQDIDGDGLKDIVVRGRYSYEGEAHQLMIEADYSVYYQRTGGFVQDREIKKSYRCGEEETMEEIVEACRAYWGWKQEE